jgi:hypothetical protein
VSAPSRVEDPLKFRPASQPTGLAEALRHHTRMDIRKPRPPRRLTDAVGRLRRRHREALPALRPAPLEDQSTVLGGHTDQKAVRAPAAPAVRLECSLHDFRIPCNERTISEKPR